MQTGDRVKKLNTECEGTVLEVRGCYGANVLVVWDRGPISWEYEHNLVTKPMGERV